MAVQTRADLEEERRLFYVALTRAEKQATLSYAMSRFKWGNFTSSEPSRFIEEIDPEFLEMPVQNERGAFSGGSYARPSGNSWARGGRPFGKDAEDQDSKPIYGRERKAPPVKPTRSSQVERASVNASAPAPGKLKRMSASGKVLEATKTLGEAVPDLKEGMTVEHERFGKGKVLKIEGIPPDVKATIFFPTSGQKNLLLRFAKLKVLLS